MPSRHSEIGASASPVPRAIVCSFWSAIVVLLMVFNVSIVGPTLDLIGAFAVLAGLGVGLWLDELT